MLKGLFAGTLSRLGGPEPADHLVDQFARKGLQVERVEAQEVASEVIAKGEGPGALWSLSVESR